MPPDLDTPKRCPSRPPKTTYVRVLARDLNSVPQISAPSGFFPARPQEEAGTAAALGVLGRQGARARCQSSPVALWRAIRAQGCRESFGSSSGVYGRSGALFRRRGDPLASRHDGERA